MFKTFARALAVHFAGMSAGELFRTAVLGDYLWEQYLAAFPEGTNPIFRVRTYHDGSYDRSFIRKMGNVVRINADGTLTTIWDVQNLPYPYDVVAARMAEIVRNAELDTVFRINERKISIERNVENKDGVTTEFFHFHADIDARHYTRDVGKVVGDFNSTAHVITRGFEEITPAAAQQVMDWIEENTLYRGTEFKTQLANFQAGQALYKRQTTDQQRRIIVFANLKTPGARIRNSAIGTLLQDLSEGKDPERALRSYEQITAPANYKRPTAAITPKMIDAALDTVRSLGLESALERRFATIADVSINDVLWADASAQSKMRDGLRDALIQDARVRPVTDRAELIPADLFVADVLPKAISMELFFAGHLQPNLMSITAPVHADAGNLFKWGNNFAWSYDGNVTDSIKEKVKAAGGNVDAKLRVSLAWFNFDDLDLHCQCPEGHVYYGAPTGTSTRHTYSQQYRNGRILDVDMNAGSGQSRTPVENLSWRDPQDGTYRIWVNQFSRRETRDLGFTMEIECDGVVQQISYPKAVAGDVPVITLTVKGGKIVATKIDGNDLVARGIAQQKWGVTTEQYVKVATVLNSPNHWDGERTGNKHLFFILDGCLNDQPARGIYNEFLKPELEVHRKVFEVLGNKTKCPVTAEQLSGLGFSSTQRSDVIVKVTTSTSTRTYKVQF